MAEQIFHVSYAHWQDLNNYIRQLRNKFKFQYGMNVLEMSKRYFPEAFLLDVINAPTDTEAEITVLNYWRKNREKTFIADVVKHATELEKYINKNQKLITDPLEKLYQHQFPFNNINIFLTTFYRCPYNYPYWFMAYSTATPEKLMKISIHELNHFMFYNYWKDYFRKQDFTEKQFEYLKEALAVLTNLKGEENKYKVEVKPIQDFIKQNTDKPLDKIIDLVIKSKLLDNIK